MTRQEGFTSLTEPTIRGRVKDVLGAPLAQSLSVSQCRSGIHTSEKKVYNMSVPVVDINRKPLMPTTASRARRWIKLGEATPFFNKGIFCVRLNREPSGEEKQDIAVGVDPGSKKEGFTVKSETRKMMRKVRRQRKTPYRQNRKNRSHGGLVPSTKARWQWKLNILKQLCKIYPITDFVVEDIKVKSKGKRNWDKIFSPLQIGKTWFYKQLRILGNVELKQGWETAELRNAAGLKKTSKKMAEVFEAHCVDSWVLANWLIGGHIKPDNVNIICISPIHLHRRQLHILQPAKGSVRKLYGGTRSCGFKRGSLVKHSKYRFVYIGGMINNRVSLHSIINGKRLCQNAKPSDIIFKTYNIWKMHYMH